MIELTASCLYRLPAATRSGVHVCFSSAGASAVPKAARSLYIFRFGKYRQGRDAAVAGHMFGVHSSTCIFSFFFFIPLQLSVHEAGRHAEQHVADDNYDVLHLRKPWEVIDHAVQIEQIEKSPEQGACQ